MYLVIDSGSTKADWVLSQDAIVKHTFSTTGFNPVFHPSTYIYQEVMKALPKEIDRAAVQEIFFYGAGCWDAPRKSVIQEAFTRLFPKASVLVEHDLLGAARATCGSEPGIACILGTGSNSCAYDGTCILDNVTNLGYLLGDEGSGSHIGKLLIKAYFYRDMPQDLIPAFEKYIAGGKKEILDKVYGKETPNRYLASFTLFASAHKDHPFLRHILREAFDSFIQSQVSKYEQFPSYPIHFVGSVAFHFREILEQSCQDRGGKVGRIIQKPIKSLVEYHLQTTP